MSIYFMLFTLYLHQETILREETFSEILVKFRSRDVTSSNLVFFWIFVKLGPENDPLNYSFSKLPADILKNIVLAS